MRRYCGLIMALLMTGRCTYAAGLPKLDFTDFTGYMRTLQISSDPRAKVILQEIRQGPADLKRERAAARREGLPLRLTDLAQPLPPSSKNAAPLYHKLAVLLKSKPLDLPGYALPMSAAYSYTPEQIARVRGILARRQDVMSLIHKAANRPGCVFAIDWSQDSTKVFGELQPGLVVFRDAERLLRTESFLLARQGKYREAVRDEELGLRMAGHIASEPWLISYLVATACRAIAVAGLRDILLLAGANAAVDACVRQALVSQEPGLSLRHALWGEVSFGVAELEHTRFKGPQAVQELVDPTEYMNPGSARGKKPSRPLSRSARRFLNQLLDEQEAYYLHGVRQLMVAADKPAASRNPVFKQVSVDRPDDPVVVVGAMDFSIDAAAARDGDRFKATTEVLLSAAAVLQFRAKYGVLPPHLPGSFIDPYTGKPLSYHLEGNDGFKIYSRGENKTVPAAMPWSSKPDPRFFFRYPPPAQKPAQEDSPPRSRFPGGHSQAPG